MLDKLRFVIGVFIVPKMLLESYTKRAASLSDVFHVTIRASKLIDSTIVECLLIRILLMVFLVVNVILTEESLKSLVMNLVSLSAYVNCVHFVV